MKESYSHGRYGNQRHIKAYGLDMHWPVFFLTTVFILVFVVVTLLSPALTGRILEAGKQATLANFDWLLMISGNVFVAFCLSCIFLPVGRIRLGGVSATPEFSTLSWFAMLFAAGMGIGLMFWGVAEPMAHYTGWAGTPLNAAANTPEGAETGMAAAIFHWGLHAWAIYAVVGLALAFFAYNKGMPLALRSVFYPILGERTWGWAGHTIDIIAVLATAIGLATSLGLGARQVASGFHFLFGTDAGLVTQLVVISGVTLAAVFSVVRGLDRGVRVLSNLNLWLAMALLLFIVVAGPSAVIFKGLATNVEGYFSNILSLSNWIDRNDGDWYRTWTVFYWAWWISWSPFVGAFIARVSRGRTVREFIVAVLVLPTVVCTVWMSVFGTTAIYQAEGGIGQLANGLTDVSIAMFHMLDSLPLSSLTSVVGIVLVVVFFVTSADSGALVISIMTAGGISDSTRRQHVFWATMSGLVAAMLLVGGGAETLGALQSATIVASLPFALLLLLMCGSVYLGLRDELQLLETAQAR